MSKVWVLHPVKDDISAASQFGTIKYITEGYVHHDQLTDAKGLPPDVLKKLIQASYEFVGGVMSRPVDGDDFLLIAGDHLQLVQFSVLLSERFVRFKVLRYDREAQGYYPVVIVTK